MRGDFFSEKIPMGVCGVGNFLPLALPLGGGGSGMALKKNVAISAFSNSITSRKVFIFQELEFASEFHSQFLQKMSRKLKS